MQEMTVVKNDHTGREVWRYSGIALERTLSFILLEARFGRDEMRTAYTILRKGDRFVEYYYTDRWYAIYEVHDRDDGHLKGWYCNFNRPARFEHDTIYHDDLALDLWVYPDRKSLILDREDFDGLELVKRERDAVLAALVELQEKAREGAFPFSANHSRQYPAENCL